MDYGCFLTAFSMEDGVDFLFTTLLCRLRPGQRRDARKRQETRSKRSSQPPPRVDLCPLAQSSLTATCQMPTSPYPADRTLTTTSAHSYALTPALAILHSPSSLISLNPLVLSHSLLSSSPTSTTYTITDSLTFLGWHTTTSYEATFTPTARGVDVVARAAMGVETRSRWRVEEEGRVVEEGELRAPWWCVRWVEGVWQASHGVLMRRLEERLGDTLGVTESG